MSVEERDDVRGFEESVAVRDPDAGTYVYCIIELTEARDFNMTGIGGRGDRHVSEVR